MTVAELRAVLAAATAPPCNQPLDPDEPDGFRCNLAVGHEGGHALALGSGVHSGHLAAALAEIDRLNAELATAEAAMIEAMDAGRFANTELAELRAELDTLRRESPQASPEDHVTAARLTGAVGVLDADDPEPSVGDFSGR